MEMAKRNQDKSDMGIFRIKGVDVICIGLPSFVSINQI